MKTRWLLRAAALLVLGLVFCAYLLPDSMVVLANLWALCGF